jgi:hypothetical protein
VCPKSGIWQGESLLFPFSGIIIENSLKQKDMAPKRHVVFCGREWLGYTRNPVKSSLSAFLQP